MGWTTRRGFWVAGKVLVFCPNDVGYKGVCVIIIPSAMKKIKLLKESTFLGQLEKSQYGLSIK